jgi:hypothetical protein
MNDQLFIATMAIIVLIIVMSAIQIALVIINDSKVWAKLDRIVTFFMNERNGIIVVIKEIKEELLEVKKELLAIKDKINLQ